MSAGNPHARRSGAHRQRDAVNAAAADHDLEAWVLDLVPACPGQRILDLGCGAGKLTLPYGRAVGPEGRVVGLDVAADSVSACNRRAAAAGLPHVTARVGDLNRVVDSLAPQTFDRIVSSYAIYYATSMSELLVELRARLARHGILFVCGPGGGTNAEMTGLLARVAPDVEELPEPVADFITPEQIATVARRYPGGATTHRLANTVRFEAPEPLLTWWRQHSMYVAHADAAVETAVRRHFDENRDFRMTKNVLGVSFRATG